MTLSNDDPSTGSQEAAKQDLPVFETVLNLAADDPALSDRQKMLVLASLESSDAIISELDGSSPSEQRVAAAAAGDAQTDVAAVGAFLNSITVSGFRGIGQTARLNLHPGPGLTVVAGRNGSGKSSFAEALEFALTDDSYRWAGKATFWKDSWRNLHQTDPAAVRIELAEEGVGRTEIGVEWLAGAALEDRKVWTQRAGAKRADGVDSLG